MAKPWRGPFKVWRDGPRGKWMIINRWGGAERLGYTEKATANTVCRLMNEAHRRGKEPAFLKKETQR